MKKPKKRRRRRVRHRGIHRSIKMGVDMTFRSGWELSYFKHLDNDPAVTAFYSEQLRIPYVSNKSSGRLRNYVPDLLVEYVDGSRKLIEIKPSKRVDQPKNQKKFAAARAHCAANGLEFVIVTERELKVLGLL